MSGKTKIISLAKKKDFAEISEVYSACSKKMNLQGRFNWNESYPDAATIQSDIDNSRLWKTGNPIHGVVSLEQEQALEYNHLKWLWKNNYIVIRRLAVHPKFQGQGIAKNIISEIEMFLQDAAYGSIRLDVFSESKSAIAFYQKLGYQERGSFNYEGYKSPFIAMEKAI